MTRSNAQDRGYDAKWQKLRADWLRNYPDCRGCKQPATLVDHVIPLRLAGRGAVFDTSRLQSLCRSCHGAKVKLEKRYEKQEITAYDLWMDSAVAQRLVRRPIGTDGWLL